MFVTATSSGSMPLNFGSLDCIADVTIVYATGPSATASSMPVIVTVCGAFQFAGVNVSVSVSTLPSVRSLVAIGMTTLLAGCALSATVNIACPPDSVVVRPPVGVITAPGASLSSLVSETSTVPMSSAATSTMYA